MGNPAVFFMQGDEGQVGEGCEVDRTKRIFIDSITQTILMNPLGRESCSAEASTIPGFHLHCVISESTTILFARSTILLCWRCPSVCSKKTGIPWGEVSGVLFWGKGMLWRVGGDGWSLEEWKMYLVTGLMCLDKGCIYKEWKFSQKQNDTKNEWKLSLQIKSQG